MKSKLSSRIYIKPDKESNKLYPLPEVGQDILIYIDGEYIHCQTIEEHQSFEEGGHSFVYLSPIRSELDTLTIEYDKIDFYHIIGQSDED